MRRWAAAVAVGVSTARQPPRAAAAAPPPQHTFSSPPCVHSCCREELQQPVFMAIDALEFPELHDESIPALAFIRHLARLLQVRVGEWVGAEAVWCAACRMVLLVWAGRRWDSRGNQLHQLLMGRCVCELGCASCCLPA